MPHDDLVRGEYRNALVAVIDELTRLRVDFDVLLAKLHRDLAAGAAR